MVYLPAINKFELRNFRKKDDTEMDGIPNCGNFKRRYPGIFFDRENVFLQVNINLTRRDEMKKLLAIFISKFFPGLRGKRTHIHAVLAIACYAFAAVICYKAANWLGLAVLAGLINHVCSQGASRWTMKAIEKKIDLILAKYGLELKRD
jgi:hypothetical protein